MPHSYTSGALIRVTATFADDETGQPVDPDAVTLELQAPDGDATTVTMSNAAPGQWFADVDTTAAAPGIWIYRARGTGSGQAADEGAFLIRA